MQKVLESIAKHVGTIIQKATNEKVKTGFSNLSRHVAENLG